MLQSASPAVLLSAVVQSAVVQGAVIRGAVVQGAVTRGAVVQGAVVQGWSCRKVGPSWMTTAELVYYFFKKGLENGAMCTV